MTMLNRNWTRRTFLGRAALTTGAVICGQTAIHLLTSGRAWAADFGSDVDVLNYALTLEYLEAGFYKLANASGKITNADQQSLLQLVQADEEAHVAAIQTAIQKVGGAPVAAPRVTFPAGTFDSSAAILKLAKTFEETGVGAYLGAAGSIKNKDILQAAASIFGVEARHAAAIGYVSGLQPEGGIYMGATETPKAKATVLEAVAPLLASMPNTGLAPEEGSPVNLLPAGLAAGGALAALIAFRTRGSREDKA